MSEECSSFCEKLQALKDENESIRQNNISHAALRALFEDADRTIAQLRDERDHYMSRCKLLEERLNGN